MLNELIIHTFTGNSKTGGENLFVQELSEVKPTAKKAFFYHSDLRSVSGSLRAFFTLIKLVYLIVSKKYDRVYVNNLFYFPTNLILLLFNKSTQIIYIHHSYKMVCSTGAFVNLKTGEACLKCAEVKSRKKRLLKSIEQKCHSKRIMGVVSGVFVCINNYVLHKKINIEHIAFSSFQYKKLGLNFTNQSSHAIYPIIRKKIEKLEQHDKPRFYDLVIIGGKEKYKSPDLVPQLYDTCLKHGKKMIALGFDNYGLSANSPSHTQMSRVENKEVLSVLLNSKIFLHISASPETFGRTIYEALEAGCVVLARDIGPKREIFPNLVYFGDDEELMEKLYELLFLSIKEVNKIREVQRKDLERIFATNALFLSSEY
jgi:glycosyltransferase involved in cell wall biosynthesis